MDHRIRKSIGPCAKSCKGRPGAQFRSCVRSCMRGGRRGRR